MNIHNKSFQEVGGVGKVLGGGGGGGEGGSGQGEGGFRFLLGHLSYQKLRMYL